MGSPDAPSSGRLALRWGGEELVALADHALFWPRRRTLCVADLHLGKAAAFRAANIPVPEQATGKDLDRLTSLIDRYQPRRLVILGDLLHARSGRAVETMAAVAAWRTHHADLDVLLVRGNHDVRAGDPPADWRMRILSGPCADADDGRIAFAHDPDECDRAADDLYVLCGHLHPAVSLPVGPRGLRARCFSFGHTTRLAILPAFGTFTGSSGIVPQRGDQVLAIGDDEILDVTRAIF